MRLLHACDPAVEHDRQARMRGLEPIDARVIERRNFAVLLRRQSFEPSLSRVNDERIDARLLDRAGKNLQRLFRVLLVDADAAFHRDGNRHGGLHGRHGVADQSRLRHEAGAEAAVLHAVGRAAGIQIDLVKAKLRADARARGERARIGAAKLQRQRMLGRIVAQKPRAIAVQHRAGGEHLRIEQRPARQQAMEEPAVPVSPFHHRRDGKAAIQFQRLSPDIPKINARPRRLACR